MLRIVGGEFRGRKLLSLPKGVDVRPSSGRVRGAIFDRLQQEVIGRRVLDLFAGSGALSIEALSRGAKVVTLVERSRRLQVHLKRQIADLGIGSRAEVRHMDAQRFLGEGGGGAGAFDLVFASFAATTSPSAS